MFSEILIRWCLSALPTIRYLDFWLFISVFFIISFSSMRSCVCDTFTSVHISNEIRLKRVDEV